MLKIISTRDNNVAITFKEALINGLAKDGGLYTFEDIKSCNFDYNLMENMNYLEMAKYLLSYLTNFTKEELDIAVNNAYTNTFSTEDVVSIKDLNNFSLLELHHGPTSAFKDVALQLLPELLSISLKEKKKRAMILTATSGDTGKAALEGFKNKDNIKITVLFPEGKVSSIQSLQMRTSEGKNTHVASIKGNFDDCQRICKESFMDQDLIRLAKENNYLLSSANSINIGRLCPQIIYYFYTYFDLLKKGTINKGEVINFVVPSGNFGDVLAGYYAKELGLPVNRFIVATNDNTVLSDFINTGVYDKRRDLVKTISPSMDIIVSSNVERLLYELYHDTNEVSKLMHDLKTNGVYTLSETAFKKLQNSFFSYSSTEEDCRYTIKNLYEKENTIIDTHTSCGVFAYQEYLKTTDDSTYTVVLQTASPYKFSDDVFEALTSKHNLKGFDAIAYLESINVECAPKKLKDLEHLKVIHKTILDQNDVKNYIIKNLKEE